MRCKIGRGAPARRARPWVARPAVLAGGLAALALAAAGGVELATSGGGSPVRVISASIGDAQLRVVGGHGELVVRRLRAPRPGRIYELWIQRGRQAPTPSTLFSTTSSGTADIGVPGRLVDVRAVLVTEEPAGGTQAPTSQPVIVARLAS